MRVFISGTSTDIGKTIICSWLCSHTKYSYFKPIQTGHTHGSDKKFVQELTGTRIYEEVYSFKQPFSPHLAAKLDNDEIDIQNVTLPSDKNLIVEGAGGLFVPLNERYFLIDLIKNFKIPTILVASTKLGTINHTLLSLEALRARNLEIIGVILNGAEDKSNQESIEFYGKVPVLATFPIIHPITKETLMNVKLSERLRTIFQ